MRKVPLSLIATLTKYILFYIIFIATSSQLQASPYITTIDIFGYLNYQNLETGKNINTQEQNIQKITASDHFIALVDEMGALKYINLKTGNKSVPRIFNVQSLHINGKTLIFTNVFGEMKSLNMNSGQLSLLNRDISYQVSPGE